jgi:hypothetical protein
MQLIFAVGSSQLWFVLVQVLRNLRLLIDISGQIINASVVFIILSLICRLKLILKNIHTLNREQILVQNKNYRLLSLTQQLI